VIPDASDQGSATARGRLRIYLGYAPGVGTTCAMLREGRRRAERGTDVVVAHAETRGRPYTAGLLESLEVIPAAEVPCRDTTVHEMDLRAVLARRPQIALVDDFAHSNVPGLRHAKRWQDVEGLLAAGIDVISTVGIEHLDSLSDVVEKITAVWPRQTVPDQVVRTACEIELVDAAPEALRERMARGHIYPAERAAAALDGWFQAGNLSVLRELALLWLSVTLTSGPRWHRPVGGFPGNLHARERVVAALSGGPEGGALIRRAARIAARSGGDLLAVHAAGPGGAAGARRAALAAQRLLTESLGGTYHQLTDKDIPAALLMFAHAENATQLVLGATRRSRLSALLPWPADTQRVIRRAGGIDVHIVTCTPHRRRAAATAVGPGITSPHQPHGLPARPGPGPASPSSLGLWRAARAEPTPDADLACLSRGRVRTGRARVHARVSPGCRRRLLKAWRCITRTRSCCCGRARRGIASSS
jgi:two-component system sensor histidine kinase KdpD